MADGRDRRTTDEIDKVKSHVRQRIRDCMIRNMTKNEILSTLFEEDGVQHLVTGAEWEVLEQLDREFFERYRARLQTRPEVQTFIPRPGGSQSQLGVPLASGPQVNWQPPMPNIGALSLVQPWAPQGPHDMEDPIGIPEQNLSYNVEIMHEENPDQYFDFSRMYTEPTVNPSGLVGAVPEGSLSGIRADIPESSGTKIIESNLGYPSLGEAGANMQGTFQQQGGNGEIITRDLTETCKKRKPERNRKLITSYLRKLNKASYKISKSTRPTFGFSKFPLSDIWQLHRACKDMI